jgi:hypothetical protein
MENIEYGFAGRAVIDAADYEQKIPEKEERAS